VSKTQHQIFQPEIITYSAHHDIQNGG